LARTNASVTGLLIFGVALLLAALISELADRSIVSTAVLFLAAGFAVGPGGFGLMKVDPQSPVVARLADFALVAVLFNDGAKLGWSELRSTWLLPGRALFLGLPLTMFATALLGHYLAGLTWLNAWLIGAVLSPTDPVFAAAIVGREGVSKRLRHLLNVESGLNDGLALPIVLRLLALNGAAERGTAVDMLALLGGGMIGVATPWLAVTFERSRFFAVARSHEPLFPFAIGIVVFAVAELVHANQFIAAFAAGVTLATVRPSERSEASAFTENFSELLKLAALLVFGMLISPSFLSEIPVSGYVFAALALVVARPAALAISLAGAPLPGREKIAAAWFGPKGFASVVYGILVLESGIKGGDQVFHLIALVVAASIIAHSSTDVIVARWLHCAANQPDAPTQGRAT
jgi:NhaP-type Na+/H+ or K+/H+ antiporter